MNPFQEEFYRQQPVAPEPHRLMWGLIYGFGCAVAGVVSFLVWRGLH